MSLISRNVFIDTEFFVKANLDFNSRTVKSFEDLCNRDEFRHITTTIVVKEINRKISEQIKEALKGIKNFRRKAVLLKEYDDESIQQLFTEINEEHVEDKALEAFSNFIEQSNADVIDMSKVDLNEVIEMYFNHDSPFSAKKPNEFRDAFTLLALRAHLKEHEKIYIVSDDPDHKKFCEDNDNFINIETLSALLDVYNKHNDRRVDFIERFLESRRDEIIQRLKSELESASAYNVSTWDDAEIDSFSVTSIEDFDPKIIHLDDESCQVNFDVTVVFQVEASGPDTANGFYDKEDGIIYTFETTSNNVIEVKEFSVELDLSFEMDEEEIINEEYYLNVKGISAGIEFDIEEHPWEDHR
ncbi:PIN domain-containing protein [Pantoea agglomerans]|uniref:PIN domain-containing protein n=1 Tax=Enterobacter agglomerans TaxID=549 RepID=UPI00301C51C8